MTVSTKLFLLRYLACPIPSLNQTETLTFESVLIQNHFKVVLL